MTVWLDDGPCRPRVSVFRRNDRFYIGPLTDSKIDLLKSNPQMRDCGLACLSANGDAAVYLTIQGHGLTNKTVETILHAEMLT